MKLVSYTKGYKLLGLLIVIGLAALWAVLALLFNSLLDPQWSYILSVLVSSIFASFIADLMGKHGLPMLFYIFGALLAYGIGDLGVIGIDKIVVLLFVGAIFEFTFLASKIITEGYRSSVSVILAAAVSSASIPLTTAILLSYDLLLSILYPMLNMMLLSFMVGLAGGSISFILWYKLNTTKAALRFRYLMR